MTKAKARGKSKAASGKASRKVAAKAATKSAKKAGAKTARTSGRRAAKARRTGLAALPKTIAGVKVPKAVRESRSLSALLHSGLGREILADALIAAAAAAAAALTRVRTPKETGQAIAEAGSNVAAATGEAVQTAAGTVAQVVAEAARSFLPASLIGEDEPAGKGRKQDRPERGSRSG